MNATSRGAEVPRVSGRIHLPSGLVTFLFTDIEGSTRLAQMLGAGYRPVLSEHRRLLARHAGRERRRRAVHRGRLVLHRVRRRRPPRSTPASPRSARWPATSGRRPRPRPGSGWDCTPDTPSPLAGEYASPEVHRAARIAAAAHGGQVLCSGATARHAAPLPRRRLAARPRPAPAARLRRPGTPLPAGRTRAWNGSSRARAPPTPAAHNLPDPGDLVRRAPDRAGRAGPLWSTSTAWSPSSAPVVPARPGSPSRWPATLVDSYPDGVWFVDIAAVTDPGLVAFAVAAVLGLRPEPGPADDRHPGRATPPRRRMLLLLDTCDAQPGAPAPRSSPGC